jgi:flavin reductase (DIM6/NTAB) family NADH-FMN oxidoreductase RutF
LSPWVYLPLNTSAFGSHPVLRQRQRFTHGLHRGRPDHAPGRSGRSGAPFLEEALAYLDCELTERLRVGDHELVVGRVIDGQILDREAAPMAYADTGDMDGSSALYPVKF